MRGNRASMTSLIMSAESTEQPGRDIMCVQPAGCYFESSFYKKVLKVKSQPARGAASLRPACITKQPDSLPAWALFSFFSSSSMIGQCPAASPALFSPGKTARRSWSRWRQFVRCRPPPDWRRRACRWCPGEVAGPVWLLRLSCEMHRWTVWVRSSQWHPQTTSFEKQSTIIRKVSQ